MIADTEQILEAFARGKISRRQAAASIAGLAMAALGRPAAAQPSPLANPVFHGVALNHIGLRVGDVERSRDFYQEHLGLSVIADYSPGNCFLRCGDNYVGLFRSSTPGMDHYCYEVKEYEPDNAQAKLREVGIDSSRSENRVYFRDPDGLKLQISGKWDSWPGPPPRDE